MANDMTTSDMHRDYQTRLMLAEQNDAFRQALGVNAFWHGNELQGRVKMSPGFRAIAEEMKATLIGRVMSFTGFSSANDPWQEHACGVIEAGDIHTRWQIEIFDTSYSFGVGDVIDATDPHQTRRVLTLSLASE